MAENEQLSQKMTLQMVLKQLPEAGLLGDEPHGPSFDAGVAVWALRQLRKDKSVQLLYGGENSSYSEKRATKVLDRLKGIIAGFCVDGEHYEMVMTALGTLNDYGSPTDFRIDIARTQ